VGAAATRRSAARAVRGLSEGRGHRRRVRQGAARRDAHDGLFARRQGIAARAEGEGVAAAAARLEERGRVARQVLRRRRGGRRSEERPDDLPLLRPRDAVPCLRKDQRARRRGDRGVVKEMKDAAAMRKRILKELPNSGEIAHRLRIQTIDAFCTALTRQVPVLARFGAQPEIVEDARDLYLEAASRVFQQFNPASEKLLAHLDNNVPLATGLLANMLDNRDRWLRKTGAVPTRAELESVLALERERLLNRARALYPKASGQLASEVLT